GLGDGMGLFYFRTDGGGSPKTFGETQEYRNAMAALGNNPSPKPTFWQRAASFVGGLFGSNKGAGITTILAGAEVSRVVQIGEILRVNVELIEDKITSKASDAWNSSIARDLVNDSYSLGLSSNVAAIIGTGTTPINFTLLTRGKPGQPGLYYTPSVNGSVGDGIEGNAGITFSGGRYTGDSRNITYSMLQGHSGGVSAGIGFIADGSLNAMYAPVDPRNPIQGGGFINVGGQIGVGIEGSPASVANIQINYQYTPIVKPIFQFK
ncbi:hypothetical protein, partial [Chryseobacterium sp. OSA05B]|uniref:hypothetical protein n=1 Tax=Chryseobacterium sp. OSA05B TaxID=2862650 RepID=UPI001CC11D1F